MSLLVKGYGERWVIVSHVRRNPIGSNRELSRERQTLSEKGYEIIIIRCHSRKQAQFTSINHEYFSSFVPSLGYGVEWGGFMMNKKVLDIKNSLTAYPLILRKINHPETCYHFGLFHLVKPIPLMLLEALAKTLFVGLSN